MKVKGLIACIGVFLLIISATAMAADYKNWLPLLPETVGGMPQSGKPDGMNMESGDVKWSSVHQRYEGDDPERYADLTLLGGNAPQMAGFQMMSNMKMETDEQIVKTVQVKGYKSLLNLEKNEKRGTLMISLGEEMLAVIEVSPITKEAEMITLGEKLPLADFAAQAK